MTDDKPLVTHADLPTLQMMRNCTGDGAESAVLLDRLIAAAEADAPTLPEGVPLLFCYPDGDERIVYLQPNGALTKCRNGGDGWDILSELGRRDALTPLRPTITEADVEKAAVVLMDRIPTQTYRDIARDMFKAAGIEVSQP